MQTRSRYRLLTYACLLTSLLRICSADDLLVFSAPLALPNQADAYSIIARVSLPSKVSQATYLCSYRSGEVPMRGHDYLHLGLFVSETATKLDTQFPNRFNFSWVGDALSMNWLLTLTDTQTGTQYFQTCIDVTSPVFTTPGALPSTKVVYPGVMSNSFGAKALCLYAYGGSMSTYQSVSVVMEDKKLAAAIPTTSTTTVTGYDRIQDFGALFNSYEELRWSRLADPACCSSLGEACSSEPGGLAVTYLTDADQTGVVPMYPPCDWNWDLTRIFMCTVPQASDLLPADSSLTLYQSPFGFYSSDQTCQLAGGSLFQVSSASTSTPLPDAVASSVADGIYWVSVPDDDSGASRRCFVSDVAAGVAGVPRPVVCTEQHPFMCAQGVRVAPTPDSPPPPTPLLPPPLAPPPATPTAVPVASPAPIDTPPAGQVPTPTNTNPGDNPDTPTTTPTPGTTPTPDGSNTPGSGGTVPTPTTSGGASKVPTAGDGTVVDQSSSQGGGKGNGWKVGVGIAFMLIALTVIAILVVRYRKKLFTDKSRLPSVFRGKRAPKGSPSKNNKYEAKGSPHGLAADNLQTWNPMFDAAGTQEGDGYAVGAPAVAIVRGHPKRDQDKNESIVKPGHSVGGASDTSGDSSEGGANWRVGTQPVAEHSDNGQGVAPVAPVVPAGAMPSHSSRAATRARIAGQGPAPVVAPSGPLAYPQRAMSGRDTGPATYMDSSDDSSRDSSEAGEAVARGVFRGRGFIAYEDYSRPSHGSEQQRNNGLSTPLVVPVARTPRPGAADGAGVTPRSARPAPAAATLQDVSRTAAWS